MEKELQSENWKVTRTSSHGSALYPQVTEDRGLLSWQDRKKKKERGIKKRKNYALQCRCLNCTLPEVKFCVKNEKIEKIEKNEKMKKSAITCDNLRQPATTCDNL